MKWWRRPLGSEKMREICRHMTLSEHLKGQIYAAVWAVWGVYTIILPFGVFTASFAGRGEPLGTMRLPLIFRTVWVPWPTWPIALCILLVALAINIPLVIYLRRKLKKFLAGTKWARAQGYTVDDL